MKFSVDMSDFGKLTALVSKMCPAGRAQMNKVGEYACAAHVKRYVIGYARGKHFSANDVGGKQTGHYEKGAEAITSSSSEDSAEVLIPIPGISRALHDINLKTPTRYGKKYLTIAKHSKSYGHTVSEMKKRGWKIFRPGRRKDGTYGADAPKVLLGYKNRGDDPVVLFTLTKAIKQPRQHSLLPSMKFLCFIFANAQKKEIERVMIKAGRIG